ncbi:hypothetical protein BD410DRAFT_684301, partial [Rickenella mellea]
HPLVHIEWFTKLGSHIAETGMHQVTKSTRQHRRRVSIIPITRVVQSCHLIP